MMKITKADFKSLVVEAVQHALGEADDETAGGSRIHDSQ